jgi:TolB-like protein/Flp pilus assembly protein TadD
MKKSMVITLFLLSCISVLPQEKRMALVIGNGNYSGSTLANPENDARSMEAALKEIGFTVIKYENLRQKEMAKAIDDFGNRLKKYDVGLFFYAGHGVQSKGFNYLIPVDADLNSESDVEYNCVRADRVLGKMEDAKSKINLVILDACRNNPFERSWTRSSKGGGLASMSAPAGSIIAFSTSPGSTAEDGSGKNSPYTSGLLNFLNEPGITAIQMFQKVRAYVMRKSKNFQMPWESTSLTGDFYLLPGSVKADNTLVLSRPDAAENTTDNERSVAVLPFKNLTGKPDLDYLVQGQNEALITELSIISQVKPLRVLSGQTAAKFVNASRSIPEIANEINVDYLIEGSVLGNGDSIILQLRLIQAFPEERPVWAQVYKSNISNVLKLHSNIAGQIIRKIGFDLSADNLAKLPLTRKVNPNTYEAYTKGMYWLNQPGQDAQKKGFDYLNEAVAIDPADPYAYAYLALGYLDVAHGPNDPGDALIKAEAAALHAIKLDTTVAETYSALAQLYLYQLWKFADAEKNFKKALTMNPNSAITHYHYSWGLYLWGRMDEAIAEHKLAQKYDPFNPQHTAWLGQLYCYVGRYNEAIEEANKSLEMRKDYPIGYLVLGRTYLEMGMKDEAIEIHRKLAGLYPEWLSELCITYIKTDHPEEAKKVLDEIEKRPDSPIKARNLTMIYAALGRKDEAFKWLAYEPHHGWVAFLAVNPNCKSLHGDPRWDDFVKRLNLPKK